MSKGLFAYAFLALCPLLLAQQTLNNASVTKLIKAGISDNLIVSMINAQSGVYDTSAQGLSALKNAGASENVIAAILAKAEQGPPANSAVKPPSTSTDELRPNPSPKTDLKGYTMDYVHSGRQWKPGIGAPRETYDEISEDIESGIVEAMEHRGFRREDSPKGVCCKFTIELLAVKEADSGPLTKRSFSVELAANLQFEDGNGRIIYKNGYVGKGTQRLGAPFERVKQIAVLDLVDRITSDESFSKLLISDASAK